MRPRHGLRTYLSGSAQTESTESERGGTPDAGGSTARGRERDGHEQDARRLGLNYGLRKGQHPAGGRLAFLAGLAEFSGQRCCCCVVAAVTEVSHHLTSVCALHRHRLAYGARRLHNSARSPALKRDGQAQQERDEKTHQRILGANGRLKSAVPVDLDQRSPHWLQLPARMGGQGTEP